ncbi:TetR/AcrR family transcriptional regulator [Nocardioides sp. Arc9.136]|uniref:TetR/AcrR family transcriptional regulator n=1 Tax=Nocardioides sp. Arc9.136 TaxID=2996826 RepID=UPI00266611B6|nr:TetR/AcrR family transcriptional regulator [Nocardioides sp. Arc9.136]WKN48367.1 helix-turn-helix domain containing protein [Nocardioides sp. Arc9.136]
MTTLQERRRRTTEREISDAALRLFEQHGVDGTTVDDIAREAGVSARTVFRYAATKERAALVPHRDLEDRAEERLDSLDPARPLLPQLEAMWRDLLAAFDDGRSDAGAQVLRLRRLMCAEPSLQLAAIGLDEERAAVLADRLAGLLDGDALTARVLVETAAAVLRTALDRWAQDHEAGRPTDLVATYDEACRRLRAVVA